MNRKALGSVLLLGPLLLFTVSVTKAQGTDKGVKRTPIAQTSPASGKEMFKAYCAACHGADARGDGPAAADLKTAPANLTTLAKRHDGKFPVDYVTNVLRSGVKAPAHGSSEMPVWGPLFASVSGRDPAVVNMRISNLVRYLETLQEK
ncbi:MAG: cytochrome c [Candidatus Acidiferrum sp.]